HEVVPALAQLNLYGPEWRLMMGFSVVGLVFAIARRQLWVLYLVSTGALMLVFASSTTQYNLRLFDAMSPLASIQYPRFVGVVRVFAYITAGYAVSEMGKLLWKPLRERFSGGMKLRSLTLVVPLIALSVPLLWGLPQYVRENHVPREEAIRTERQLGYWADYKRAAAWLREHAADEPWSRVGAFGHPYEHMLSALPIDTGLPVYTGGFVPAHTYRFFFEGQRDPEVLKALGVRFIVAMDGWGRGRQDVTHHATFGSIRIYELTNATTDRSHADACRVQTTMGRDELLATSVWGVPEEGCRVTLHRSDFPNWQATFRNADGEATQLEIQRVPVRRKGSYAAFMSVLVPSDGSLILSWEPTRADRAGGWLNIVGLIIFALLVILGLRRSWWTTLVNRFPRMPRPLQVAGSWTLWIGLVALIPIVIGVGVSRASERRYTLDRHLDEASKTIEVGDREVECAPADSGRGWKCSERWDEVRGGLFSYVYDNRYCIYAHPSPRGPKHLVFKDVELGTRLSGFYGLLDSSQGSGAVDMSVRVGDNPPIELTTNTVGRAIGFEVMTEPGPADLKFTITAARPAWRHFCFNAQVIE
ncbi:MAG: hypothetical protein ACI9OJ_003786, partial [Myxococcota bacterium]